LLTILITAILFIIFIIAAVVDIKTLEVPDWLNYAGIIIGIGLNAVYSVQMASWQPITGSLLGLVCGLALGALMYYTGQWGGGDAKLLMATGALIGIQFKPDNFAISFALNLLILGAAWGIIYTLILGTRYFSKTIRIAKTLRHTKAVATAKAICLLCATLLLVMAFIVKPLMIPLIALAITTYILIYLIIAVKSVELSSMYKWITPDKLVEGDWLVHEISIDGIHIGPRKTGLTKKQIQQIQKMPIQKLMVKYGVPFTPAFLLAFIATLIWGNIIFAIAISL